MLIGVTRANFCRAACFGSDAEPGWPVQESVSARRLLLVQLVSAAVRGLQSLDFYQGEFYLHLGIIRGRGEEGETGSV